MAGGAIWEDGGDSLFLLSRKVNSCGTVCPAARHPTPGSVRVNDLDLILYEIGPRIATIVRNDAPSFSSPCGSLLVPLSICSNRPDRSLRQTTIEATRLA